MRSRRKIVNNRRKAARFGLIPYGNYCYKLLAIEDGVFKIKPCKHWKGVSKYEAKCNLLNYQGGLLWDQVKECCINE